MSISVTKRRVCVREFVIKFSLLISCCVVYCSNWYCPRASRSTHYGEKTCHFHSGGGQWRNYWILDEGRRGFAVLWEISGVVLRFVDVTILGDFGRCVSIMKLQQPCRVVQWVAWYWFCVLRHILVTMIFRNGQQRSTSNFSEWSSRDCLLALRIRVLLRLLLSHKNGK